MPYDTLTLSVTNRVATVTVNRPDKLNALHDEVIAELDRAEEARRVGLVSKVVPPAELMSAAHATMDSMLAVGPRAAALSMEAVDRGMKRSLDQGLMLDDMREGMNAMRKP